MANMGIMKDISDSLFKSAKKVSKKSDKLIKMGEYNLDKKHVQKDIDKRKALVGNYIHQWFTNKNIDINEVPKLCKEISDREKELYKIQAEIDKIMKEIDKD